MHAKSPTETEPTSSSELLRHALNLEMARSAVDPDETEVLSAALSARSAGARIGDIADALGWSTATLRSHLKVLPLLQ